MNVFDLLLTESIWPASYCLRSFTISYFQKHAPLTQDWGWQMDYWKIIWIIYLLDYYHVFLMISLVPVSQKSFSLTFLETRTETSCYAKTQRSFVFFAKKSARLYGSNPILANDLLFLIIFKAQKFALSSRWIFVMWIFNQVRESPKGFLLVMIRKVVQKLTKDTDFSPYLFFLFFHRPGQSKFQQKWLKDIIDCKIALMSDIRF